MNARRELRFVALGDSSTVGVGDRVGDSWRGWARLLADQLAVRHGLTYANLAATGATAASVRSEQLSPALRLRPHLAALIVGVNDTMRSSWDPARVRDDVLACLSALTHSGALVMTVRFHDQGEVFGLPAVLRRPLLRRIEAVNQAYDEAHALVGGLRIDLATTPCARDRRYWSVDRLHPNALGHRLLAAEFTTGLRALGYDVTAPPDVMAQPPSPWRDLGWLATEGTPWVARRARDLGPWVARMALNEAHRRLQPRPMRTSLPPVGQVARPTLPRGAPAPIP